MSKKTTTKKQPPLHVELSDMGAAALKKIQAVRSWNKKTAVETALQTFALTLKTP